MQAIHITFGDCFISDIRLSSECSEQLRFSDDFVVNWRRKLAAFVLVALRVELNDFLTGQYLRTMFSLVSSIYYVVHIRSCFASHLRRVSLFDVSKVCSRLKSCHYV